MANYAVQHMSQSELFSLVEFGGRLRAARKARGLNQADFSALGAVKLQTQSRYEQGLTEPGAEYLALLANRGIDVTYVLTGRQSVDLLDETSSGIVTAVRALDPAQQQFLLAFLSSLGATATVTDRRDGVEPVPAQR